MSLKFVFLGGPGVGKTSIINRYLKKSTETTPTVTASFIQQKVKLLDKEYTLGIWDTAGSEQYRSIAPIYFRNTNVAFIVTDATNANSDEDARFWMNELSSKCENSVIIVLVMNKVDVVPVNNELEIRLNRLSSRTGGKCFFTSAIDGAGINDIFEYGLQATAETLKVNPEVSNQIKEQVEPQKWNCC